MLLAFAGCGRPPQLGDDRESFKAVDALYTAVSLRNPQHLDRCERVLHDLQAKEKLSAAAGGSLDAIIAEARGGEWEEAQARLATFMRGQRR
jgi:hypothetical protein